MHQRYEVPKADGSPVDEDAVYFVLRLDSGGSDPPRCRGVCRVCFRGFDHGFARATKTIAQDEVHAARLSKDEFSPEAQRFIERGLSDDSQRVEFEPSTMEITDFDELRKRRDGD